MKHNLLRYRGARAVKVECTLILFDRNTNRISTANQSADLDRKAFANFAKAKDWDTAAHRFSANGGFAIESRRVAGTLPSASWSLSLNRSDEPYFHYTPPRLYTSGWPKKKLLTRDVRVVFDGELAIGDHKIAGTFVGMNGHNWGAEHAYRYAYGNCQIWEDGADAVFDGFSAKVRVAPGIISPYVTLASLKLDGDWHNFNRLSAVPWHRVTRLSDYRWAFRAQNRTHRLEADIDGHDAHTRPWVALNYQHPSRAVSVIKNTKFASGIIRLIESATGRKRELRSNFFELETLLETNRASAAEGFRASAV